ncbi:hypothetical protein [Salinisphaera sp. Q1T1-3]|uniref:hypothetical protein n=1 Tax=Salinisphaera sp. Q1T1-3 TaxID=2321229 RepID=UPI0011C43514|nr:hypothetical protein [Salinisphaera sp. Q1T1-3]
MHRTNFFQYAMSIGTSLGLLSLILPAARDTSEQMILGWEAFRVSIMMLYGLGECAPCWVIAFAAVSNGLFLLAPFLALRHVSHAKLMCLGIVSVSALLAGMATPILVSLDSSASITPHVGYYVWLLGYVALIAGCMHDLWRDRNRAVA